MTTLIDLLPNGIRQIIEDWHEPPQPAPPVLTKHIGMDYCPVCHSKTFTAYLVWIDTGPRLGTSIRPQYVPGHDQCVDLLARAYEQEMAELDMYSCYFYDPQVRG